MEPEGNPADTPSAPSLEAVAGPTSNPSALASSPAHPNVSAAGASARSASVTSSLSTTYSAPAPSDIAPVPFAYSSDTAKVLARLSRELPTLERAKQDVRTVITLSENLPIPAGSVPPRGRGRPKGSGKKQASSTASTPQSSKPPSAGRGRGRGSGRGRGRGGGRGGKRKRDSDDDDEVSEVPFTDDSADEGAHHSASDELTPLPLKTKSGRSVTRPAQFVPTASPTQPHKKKRRGFHRNPENAVCKICERGHSPSNNQVVFCDGCSGPYHQFCHNPPIGKQVVDVPDMAWYCSLCQRGKFVPEAAGLFFRGQNMTDQEKRSALESLPKDTLIGLLLHSHESDPDQYFFPDTSASKVASESNTGNANNSSDGNGNGNGSSTNPAPVEEPYDGYDTDPPAHYPKAGNGLARTLPPEADDIPWLIEHSFDSISHHVNNDASNLAVNGNRPSLLDNTGTAAHHQANGNGAAEA